MAIELRDLKINHVKNSILNSEFWILNSLVWFFLILPVMAFSLETPLNPSTSNIPPKVKDPAALIKNELAMLDNLIDVTKQNLENQKNLRQMIQQYMTIQEVYIKNPDDKEVLYRMVKVAHRTLDNIKQNHLTHLFDADFISELSLMSQIANKRSIPKP
jgi:hypothetical protein